MNEDGANSHACRLPCEQVVPASLNPVDARNGFMRREPFVRVNVGGKKEEVDEVAVE